MCPQNRFLDEHWNAQRTRTHKRFQSRKHGAIGQSFRKYFEANISYYYLTHFIIKMCGERGQLKDAVRMTPTQKYKYINLNQHFLYLRSLRYSNNKMWLDCSFSKFSEWNIIQLGGVLVNLCIGITDTENWREIFFRCHSLRICLQILYFMLNKMFVAQ